MYRYPERCSFIMDPDAVVSIFKESLELLRGGTMELPLGDPLDILKAPFCSASCGDQPTVLHGRHRTWHCGTALDAGLGPP